MTVAGQSWGRYPQAFQQFVALNDRTRMLPSCVGNMLPHGNGRSYGDSCLNPNGTLLLTRGLDRFVAFDPYTGLLRCEAGMTLAEILQLVIPQGWFLPVTPGTRHATVGGAIANDVHGKNHHSAGTFGDHVIRFELLRSDGERIVCAPHDTRGFFAATVGGLGLTGLLTWAEVQLRRIPGPWLETESVRFGNLDEFFSLSGESAERYEYTVAWVDCLASGKALGRGHFLRGDHAAAVKPPPAPRRGLSIPFTPPLSLVNRLTLAPFNQLYYHRQRSKRRRAIAHYTSYFYPLDGIERWNRMYGPRGFLQHQCVIPPEHASDAIKELLREIARSGAGSFLAVLKEFGNRPACGLLSFPRPGTTLALDFPNTGPDVLALLNRLDQIVAGAQGAIYPAKDARMSGKLFRQAYPRWADFRQFIDPQFSSGFWRRVME